MSRFSVLLVDDVPQIRMFIAMFLNRTDDFEVVAEASDGREALAKAQELVPDIVLLDLNMPGMNGMEALPELRGMLPNAVIVIFSGFESVAIAERTKVLGADAYVEKGTPAQELVDQLRVLTAEGRVDP